MNSAKRLLQLLYIGLVVSLAAWQLYLLLPFIDMDRIRELLAFIVLGVLAEWLAVSFPHGQLSGGFALVLAAYFLFGTAAAAWVAGMATLIGQGVANRGNPIHTTLFNAGQYVLAAVAAGYLYQLCDGMGGTEVSALFPLLVFVLCYMLVNHLLVYLYLLPKRRHYPGQSWLDAVKWDGLTYLLTIPLGLLIAMIYPHVGLTGLVLLFFSVLILQLILRRYIHLHVANRELKAFYEVATYLGDNPQPGELLEFILIRARNIFSYHAGVAYLPSDEHNVFTPVASSGHYARQLNQAQIYRGEGVVGEAVEARRTEIIADCREDTRAKNEDGWCQIMRSLLIVPLLSGEDELGVIVLGERRPGAFDEKHSHIMTVLGRQAVLTIEKVVAAARVIHVSSLDYLTGLPHAGTFFKALPGICANNAEEDAVIGIMLLDVDRLRNINDHYGRTAGDMLLQELAMMIKGFTRGGDLTARYGGNEFVLVLPGINGRRLMDLACDLRDMVREHYFLSSMGRQARITVCIGVAEYPQDAGDAAGLLRAGQRALDKAKKDGHNRVVAAASSRIGIKI